MCVGGFTDKTRSIINNKMKHNESEGGNETIMISIETVAGSERTIKSFLCTVIRMPSGRGTEALIRTANCFVNGKWSLISCLTRERHQQ